MTKDKCPICSEEEVVPSPDARYLPMNLINPQLVGVTLPTRTNCENCGQKFILIDRHTGEYQLN